MTSQTIPVEPFDFIIFGGTGDLAERKLIPALYQRQRAGQFSEPTRIIGASRSPLTDEEFKNFARVDILDISSVDLNSLLHRLGSRWEMHGETWTVKEQLDASLPAVSGDANRLEQVFEELLENASHAMPSGGTLHLMTTKATSEQLDHFGLPRQREAVVVEVADTGPGIPAADKSRIFESFFTTRGTGTGLGLAIVRKYVELHGGRIEERGIPGQGAHFVIILPVDGVHTQQGEDKDT